MARINTEFPVSFRTIRNQLNTQKQIIKKGNYISLPENSNILIVKIYNNNEAA